MCGDVIDMPLSTELRLAISLIALHPISIIRPRQFEVVRR